MNCKPGELAVIVRTKLPGSSRDAIPPEVLGRVVKVAQLSWMSSPGVPMWDLAESLPFVSSTEAMSANGTIIHAGCTYDISCLPDAVLSPIRPSDEPDETLSWVPVPSTLEPA